MAETETKPETKETRPPRREILSLARPQLKIVALVAVPMILVCLLCTALQTHFFLTTFGSTYGHIKSGMAREVIPMALFVGAIILLVMVPLCICVAVWLSHRLVGPMRRLAREMDVTGAGQLHGPFFFRDGDDLSFLGVALQTMRERLRTRMTACRLAAMQVEEVFRRVEEAAAMPGAGKLPGSIAELKRSLGVLQAQLDTFELEPPPTSEETTSIPKVGESSPDA